MENYDLIIFKMSLGNIQISQNFRLRRENVWNGGFMASKPSRFKNYRIWSFEL